MRIIFFKQLLYLTLFFNLNNFIFAEELDDIVTLIALGKGKTFEKAKNDALINALEQTYGVFISSKTELFNDKIVSDQLVSISLGNIYSYEIINNLRQADGSHNVSLKVKVSTKKLQKFAISSGDNVEINGELFSFNIKQQILNEESELIAITELVGIMHNLMQISYDYKINTELPKSINQSNDNWNIPINISVYANENMDIAFTFYTKTLNAISLKESELQYYRSIDKIFFQVDIVDDVDINGNDIPQSFYLRNFYSLKAIESFISNKRWYHLNFQVFRFDQNQVESIKINLSGDDEYYSYSSYSIYEMKLFNDHWLHCPTLRLNKSKEKVKEFNLYDTLTLFQIQSLKKYTVKTKGITVPFKHGGYVIYEKDGHGLVVSLFDLKDSLIIYPNTVRVENNGTNWINTTQYFKDLELSGYSDWFLPNYEEFLFLKSKIESYYLPWMGLNCSYYNEYHNNTHGFYWVTSANEIKSDSVFNKYFYNKKNYGVNKYENLRSDICEHKCINHECSNNCEIAISLYRSLYRYNDPNQTIFLFKNTSKKLIRAFRVF